jgi:MATE family multidrug resistance protein
MGLGVTGAALARTFIEFLNIFVVLKLCIKKNIHTKFDMHISKAAFKEWGHFLKYVIPIGSLLTLEWLSYELFTM